MGVELGEGKKREVLGAFVSGGTTPSVLRVQCGGWSQRRLRRRDVSGNQRWADIQNPVGIRRRQSVLRLWDWHARRSKFFGEFLSVPVSEPHWQAEEHRCKDKECTIMPAVESHVTENRNSGDDPYREDNEFEMAHIADG